MAYGFKWKLTLPNPALMTPKPLSSLLLASILLAGCASKSIVGEIVVPQPDKPLTVRPGGKHDSGLQPPLASSYLRQLRVSISEPSQPIPATEVVRMLRREGINVVANLPLDGYVYGGLGFEGLDGYSALLATFGPMGLDFEVLEREQVVEISPVKPKTWRIAIGQRKNTFTTEGESAGESGEGGGGGGSGAGGGAAGGGEAGGGAGSGIAGVVASAKESSKSSTTSEEDFWQEMQAEIDRRMVVLLPKRSPDPAPTGDADVFTAQRSDPGFDEVRVGRATINRATGAITVQAPRYLISSIDLYLKNLDAEMNTLIVMEGLVLLVSNEENEQNGFDIAGFRAFAGNYGLVVTNNALGGGLVVTRPNTLLGTTASVTAPAAVAQTALGVLSSDGLMSVFLAFLESKTQFKAVQRPYLSTSSGVPTVFSQFEKQYLNQVSQTSSAGATGGAAVAAQNKLIPFQFGTNLRIRPTYDQDHDLIRAQISLTQVVQSGSQAIDQIVNDATGTRTIRSQVPLDRRIDIQSETVVPNDSLVILGGQMVEQEVDNDSGITGLGRVLPGIFSSSNKRKSRSTYYFALELKTSDRAPADSTQFGKLAVRAQ